MNTKIDGTYFNENFIENSFELFENFKSNISWDERMKSRKTASFGKAYNYSQIAYPFQEFSEELKILNQKIEKEIGFLPNNCLINFYLDGKSKMGYHSDQTDILEENTGVVIVSLGETRIIRFRNIENPEIKMDFELNSGSLFYMIAEVQEKWQHAIPKKNTENGRMSLTFRALL
ncbi:alpha-ketoglutarate-dependent dioxygenase AlkB [Aureivirga sp. CE67]|uniref:alpha-ketoglutarate-dependent dioxygenase AlkB n=1 Tax=Aureivirga sp. CE67 TaxID=1788983 RepID=UPI001E57A24C|nr:alpha-ketoglutarate-dependent dioxygenase AlkB [Aureivirga sp. CE67]